MASATFGLLYPSRRTRLSRSAQLDLDLFFFEVYDPLALLYCPTCPVQVVVSGGNGLARGEERGDKGV